MRKTKRITSLLLALCMLMVFIPNVMATVEVTFSGTGTEEDPYLITGADDMKALSDAVNSGTTYEGEYFKVSDDVTEAIVLTTEDGFAPIGTSSNNFNGTFDGNNKSFNLDIDVGSNNYAGLFGYAENVVLKNIKTTGSVSGNSYVGGVAGYTNYCELINCHNSASITSSYYVGGIVGETNAKNIYNCSNSGLVTGTKNGYIGGIVGRASSSAGIYNSYNSGRVTYTGDTAPQSIGGIVGYSWYGYVQNCLNSAMIADGTIAGGIIGNGITYDGRWVNNYYQADTAIYGVGYNYVDSNWVAATEENAATTSVDKAELFTEDGLAPLNVYAKNNTPNDVTLYYWQATGEEGSEVISFTDVEPALPYSITNNSGNYITVNPTAKTGETVTITPDVEDYMTLTGVKVTDKSGNEVVTAKQDNGTYTFTMPESDVTLLATVDINFTKVNGVYQIASADDMKVLSDAVAGGFDTTGLSFKVSDSVTEPIVLTTDGGFAPIGTNENNFNGTFDGNNKIFNLTLSKNSNYTALFGNINNAVLKNIKTTGSVRGIYFVGGVVGYSSGSNDKIINCHNTANISGIGDVGGIVGDIRGALAVNCSNSGSIAGSADSVGGVIGSADSSSEAVNLINTGSVTGNGKTGGIIGNAWSIDMANCVNNGAVNKAEGSEYAVGGIAGSTYVGGVHLVMTNCYYNKDKNEDMYDVAYDNEGNVLTSTECGVSGEEIISDTVMDSLNVYSSNNTEEDIALLYWQVTGEEDSEIISFTDVKPELPYNITNNSKYLTVSETAKVGESVEITVGEMPAYVKLAEIILDGEVLKANEEGKYVFTMPSSDVTVDAEIGLVGIEQDEDGRYEISTSDELNIFAKAINGGMLTDADAVLTADVTVSTEGGFKPIGSEENPYAGYFYADGHTVTLDITEGVAFGETNATGLFGVTDGAHIYNIILKGSVDGGANTDAYTGALIGATGNENTYVYNVYSEANVSGNGYIGGIVGSSGEDLYLRNIINNGAVTQTNTAEDKKAVGAVQGIGDYYYDNVYYNSDKNSGMYDTGYDENGTIRSSDKGCSSCTAEELFADGIMDELNSYSMGNSDLLYWDFAIVDDVQTAKLVDECPVVPYKIYPANEMSSYYTYTEYEYSRAGKTITVETYPFDDFEEGIEDITGIRVTDSRGTEIEVKKTGSDEYEFVMPAKDVKIEVIFEYALMTGENGEYYISSAEDLITFARIVACGDTDANAKVMTKKIDIYEYAEMLDAPVEEVAMPIGYGYYDDMPYEGEFDGNGATINWYGSLFFETDGAVIKNLNYRTYDEYSSYVGGLIEYANDTHVDNCNVEMYVYEADRVGGIVYSADGDCTITNCSVSAEGYTDWFGGMVYKSYGHIVIANCVLNECDLDYVSEYGGIINCAYGEAEIYNCVVDDYFDDAEMDYAGAIVCGAYLSELTLENNFFDEEVGCYDVSYDYGADDDCYGMTDKNSAVSEDEIWGCYISAKLNEYIEANPGLVKGVELNKWSAYYDEDADWIFACFADKNNPEIYSINQNGIKVGTFIESGFAYGTFAGEEVFVAYVPSGAEVTVTDEDGNEIELTAVTEDEGLGADLLSEVPEDAEIALLVDDSPEGDYYTFTMPESDVTVSVVLDAGIEETTVIDGKTYAVVKTADDFIKAVTSIAKGNGALNVLLAEDITLTEELLENYPLHNMSEDIIDNPGLMYNGIFDGAGHTVTFEGYEAEGAAMLGVIGKDGIVKNITVDGTITGTESAAGIALVNSGTILNCINKADINSVAAAGLVFINTPLEISMSNMDLPKVINCINKGDINGTEGAAAVAYRSEGLTLNVVNEGTITNPGEDGNMIFDGYTMGSGILDLTDEEYSDVDLTEAAAELNDMIEMAKAMLESGYYPGEVGALALILNDMAEWSILETDSSAEVIFADEENAPYYIFETSDERKVYKAGDTVEVTFDTSGLEEGFELSGARVVMEYSDDEIEITPVEGKDNTYSFTMPNGYCYSEMLTEATGVEKDEDGYYLVATLDDLMKVKTTIDNGNNAINIRLTADIEGYADEPIGGGYGYNGTFDGNNHTITLAMDGDGEYYDEYGLFGILDNDAVVKDLTIAGTISANADYIGSVAGLSGGAIVNCTNNAVVTSNDDYSGCAGGIVGGLVTAPYDHEPIVIPMSDEETDEESLFPGLIRNCENNGEVYGYYAGGIAGECATDMLSGLLSEYTATIKDCTNNAAVAGRYVGGIVASTEYAVIDNCVNNAELDGREAGGIAECAENTVIDNCVNNGDVYANYIVGGIVAEAEYKLEVANCVNNGDVCADGYCAGGIAGYADADIEVINCINNGDVQAESDVAGIVAMGEQGLKIKNCYNSGNISGDYDVSVLANHYDYLADYGIPMSLMSEEAEAEENYIIIKNSFYIQNDEVNKRLESANIPMEFDYSEAVTEDDILSGYVAAKLNSGVTDGLNHWAVKDGAVVFADEDDELYYEVVINENITGGSVTADKQFAKAGETVILTIEAEEEGKMPVITGVKLDENNSFVMPAKTVRINAVFGDTFTGTEKNDVIELMENVEMEEIRLSDYVEFENDAITRDFTFTLAEGSELPEGLKLSYGRISGTPAEAGEYTVVFDVKDTGAVSLMALEPDKAIGEAQLTLTFKVSEEKVLIDKVTETSGGKQIIRYSVPEGTDYILIIAKYNDDGSMKSIEVIASADDTNNGELIVDSSENVKVMLWSDLTEMLPLCQSYEVK